VPSVLYLHGFASSPQSRKIELLRERFAGEPIALVVPDLNVPSFAQLDVEAMIGAAVDAGRRSPPGVIAGSSLGALLALEVVRRGVKAPLVLIAPALGVSDRWLSLIPAGDPIVVFNHAREAEAPIHRAFFMQISRLTPDEQPPAVPVTAIMGRRDESVPFDRVLGVWRAWEDSGRLAAESRFVEIPDGDHSLLDYVDVIAEAIRKAAKCRPGLN
jgi:surfactin synthase thioesterase subunit